MRCFCSVVPNTTTGLSPKMLMWIAEAPDIAAPDSATACIMIAASVMPRPGAAVFLGHGDAEPGPRPSRRKIVGECRGAVPFSQ